MGDAVSHPDHYAGGGHEVIDVLEAWGLDKYANLWNVVKYIARHEHKGHPLEDLKKALFYLKREIAKREAETPGSSEQDGLPWRVEYVRLRPGAADEIEVRQYTRRAKFSTLESLKSRIRADLSASFTTGGPIPDAVRVSVLLADGTVAMPVSSAIIRPPCELTWEDVEEGAR